MRDGDGYDHVMGRTDDIINVAARRFSISMSDGCKYPRPRRELTSYSGAIEQAITSHSSVAEACVVGIPDAMKDHLPFAFVIPSAPTLSDLPAMLSKNFYIAINNIVRGQIGPIAPLRGTVQGKGIIPRTRSGKTLRRVLKELVENAAEGNYEKGGQRPCDGGG